MTDISWSVMSGPFSLFTQNKINDNVSYVLLCQGKGVVVSITLTCKYNIIFFFQVNIMKVWCSVINSINKNRTTTREMFPVS